ncbi:Transcription initiation factor TFIID subunit 9 [Lignoscripta atroalba]|nr:Transcription initiation factor TFIID subunit 9 [Lignoscripta atroalba]
MGEPNGATSEVAVADPQLAPPLSQPATATINSAFPATSLVDGGLTKRPRDARLIHMILANLGVTAYQERVPLQLMDFAYRYTSSTLQDALHLTSEGYGTSGSGGGGRGGGAINDMSAVTLPSLRLSIASRTHYQFSPNLPKEFYQELAQERNRVGLPPVGKEWGVRLPPERYCLTGVGWGLKDEWDSEGDGDLPGPGEGDEVMGEEGEANDEDEGDSRMEDIFGEDYNHGEEDKDMKDE